MPPYHALPQNRDTIDNQTEVWLALGVIEASKSPWGFPVIIVFRNGKARLCIDYRKLNLLTIPDEYPLPRQSDIIQCLTGAQWLSTFDALSGFTQLEIDERDRPLTAFRTHRGHYQFIRLPFGLRDGPSIFQRVMNEVLSEHLWIFVLVYIDDIVVYSKTFDEHVDHVDWVLRVIAEAGLTLAPGKCYLGYQSLLLLGQKVSRLGVSTHKEKVDAIVALKPPKNASELQTFLGMMVYFSNYIPFFAWIVSPLFSLLKKNAKWTWTNLEQEAFELCKRVLQSSPVLAYAQPGKGYRLYTDASDYGIGAVLQQVQAIQVKDLKGTKLYDRLFKAYKSNQPIPILVTPTSSKNETPLPKRKWAAKFDDTTVDIERVIAYWSRVFKSAEKNYSPTEKEALALKEALIKFQHFLEGEVVIAITDHKALIWSRTFQNINKRLLTWGVVYAAYPKLEVEHRPGRVHSNVDPISRLRRRIPFYESPRVDSIEHFELGLASEIAHEKDWQERLFSHLDSQSRKHSPDRPKRDSSRAEPKATTSTVKTRSQHETRKATRPTTKKVPKSAPASTKKAPKIASVPSEKVAKVASAPTEKVSTSVKNEIDVLKPDSRLIELYRTGYAEDPHFSTVLQNIREQEAQRTTKYRHYRLHPNGLLYFLDWTDKVRLCVPQSMKNHVLTSTHDELREAAHAGYERTYNRLCATYYWPRMLRDVKTFVKTCDVCQKIKHRRHAPYGKLQPIATPDKPFDVVSMDFITDLPESDGDNAILVVVDKLTKYGIFLPTTTHATEMDTAHLFTKHVIAQYGIPKAVITDRDVRWKGEFWKEVSKAMGFERNLTTAYHPQADGQTEILNQTLEVALRAYINESRSNWSALLPEFAMSYNTTPHSATRHSPAYLLYGFEPNRLATFLLPPQEAQDRTGFLRDSSVSFLESLQAARTRARDALTLAQNAFQNAYNKRRLDREFEVGDLVLINPHSLKMEGPWGGKGRKLAERFEGPFEVLEKYSPLTYRIRLPADYNIHPVINIAHLEPYHASPPKLGPRRKRPIKPRIDDYSKEDWEVTAIVEEKLSSRVQGRRHLLYRCRWMYPDGVERETDEWIPHYDINNAPEVLRKWRAKVRANPSLKAS
jgi:hypothetical protein